MNLQTLTTFAAQFAMDPNQTRYTSALYNNALNEAQNQFALDTRALYKDALYSSVANQAQYALPADFMFEKKVTFNGLRVDPITQADLEIKYRASSWSEVIGTPLYYNIDPAAASGQLGGNTIPAGTAYQSLTLIPIPQGADALYGNNIVLTYYPLPAAMANPADNPMNGAAFMAQYHIAISQYAAFLLLQSEAASQEMLAKRAELLKLYNENATKCMDRYGDTKAAGPLRMRGGRNWL